MSNIVSWFESHPVLGIIGFLIGLLGLIFTLWGVIITIRYKTKKRLFYSVTGINLIEDYSDKLDGLEMKYRNEKVKTLTVTKIAIWNSGNTTIRKEDVVQTEKLRIVVPGSYNILDFEIIQTNEPTNEFILTRDKDISESINEVILEFNYVDRKQGCVIQILHDNPDYSVLSLKGKIIGIDKVKRIESVTIVQSLEAAENKLPQNQLFTQLFFHLIPILIFSLATLAFAITIENLTGNAIYLSLLWLAVPAIILFFPLYSRVVPKSLNKFKKQLFKK